MAVVVGFRAKWTRLAYLPGAHVLAGDTTSSASGMPPMLRQLSCVANVLNPCESYIMAAKSEEQALGDLPPDKARTHGITVRKRSSTIEQGIAVG